MWPDPNRLLCLSALSPVPLGQASGLDVDAPFNYIASHFHQRYGSSPRKTVQLSLALTSTLTSILTTLDLVIVVAHGMSQV